MKALCVDDEALLLDALLYAVRQSPDIGEAVGFEDETEALAWVKENPVDVAFVDIELHEMTGIELARKLQKIVPGIDIIFCTGHSSYALDAFGVHATGYLMKPVSPEMIQSQLSYIRKKKEPQDDTLLTVRCYGNFSVYDREGRAVEFRRTKTRELLAVLIHTHGMEMRVLDLCRYLWKDNDAMLENNKKYLWNLLSDLRSSLEKIGAGEVLGKSGSGHFVNMNRIRFDDIGRGDFPYMQGYAWAAGGPLEKKGESM